MKTGDDIVYISNEEYAELKFYDNFLSKMNAVSMVMEFDPLRLTWVCDNETVAKLFRVSPEEAVAVGDRVIARVLEGTDFQESVIDQVEKFKVDPTVQWAGVFRVNPEREDIKWLIYSSSALEVNEQNVTTKIAVVLLVVDDIFNTQRTLHEFKDCMVRQVGKIGAESLTERQKQVLSLIGAGMKRKDVADRMAISIYTVADHVAAIYKKYDLSTTSQLKQLSRKLGLVN